MIGFLLCLLSTAAAVPFPHAESRGRAVARDLVPNNGYIGIVARRVLRDTEAEESIQADGGTQVVEGVHELGGVIGAGLGASLGTGLGVVRGVGSSIRNIVGGSLSTAYELTHSIGTGFQHGLSGGSNVTVEAGQLGVKDIKSAAKAEATDKKSRGRALENNETYELNDLSRQNNDPEYGIVHSNINSQIPQAKSVDEVESVSRHETDNISSKASGHAATTGSAGHGHGIIQSDTSVKVSPELQKETAALIN